MKIEEIKELVDFILGKEIQEFELEIEGLRVKLVKPKAEVKIVERVSDEPVGIPPHPEASPEEEVSEENVHFITAPMIGTFYRAPDPSSPPFVKEGEHVNKGDVLCIIEAMKLMNEVESDVDGTIKEIFVENSQPVQFGEKLFSLIPD